jgi:tetratricopeptide (TPR) repeat protein
MVCIRRSGVLAAAGIVVSAFVALFAKETGALYLVLVPLTCFFFCEKQQRKRIISSRLLLVAPVVVAYVLLRLNAVPPGLGVPTEENFWTPADGLVTRYLTVPAIWGYYLLRAVFPYFLNFETNIHLFHSVAGWQFLAGVASIVVSIALVVRFRRNAVFLWAFLFWFVSLFPFLNILLPTFESGMEHYLYLPLVAFVILVAYATPRKRVVAPVVAVLILSFAVTIFIRGQAWRDDVSLWSDAVVKTDSRCRQGWTRSRSNLGRAYIQLAENNVDRDIHLSEAEALYREILREYDDYGYAWRGLGDIAVNRNEPGRAEGFYRRAVRARPNDYMLRNKLGVVLLAQSKLEDAREQYEKSLQMNPGYPAAMLNLAIIHMRLGDYREADRLIAAMDAAALARYPNAQAIKTAIDVANGRALRGGAADLQNAYPVLDQMGLYRDEAKILEALLASDDIDPNGLYRLAMVHIVKLDDRERGIAYLDEGLRRYPNDPQFLRARALAYEQAGDKATAATLLDQLLRVAPDYPDRAGVESALTRLRSDE